MSDFLLHTLIMSNHSIQDGQCMSVRNKKDITRCPNRAKDGDIFCGIHQRAKNVQLFNIPNQNIQVVQSVQSIPTTPILTPIPTKSANNFMELGSVIHEETKVVIERIDLNDLKVKSINKIKKWIRNIWKSRCRNCCNESDFITFEKLVDIPYPFVYFHRLENNVIQGYDIRSLILYIKDSIKENPTKLIKNPYTCETFTNDDINHIHHRANLLKLSANNVKREEIPVNPEVEFQQYVLSIFQKMDFLDNYTNMDWFLHLSFRDLKKLYYSIHDIWTYRAQLEDSIKVRIVRNGFAFPVHHIVIDRMPDNEKNKRNVQKIILKEFDRFISEGVTRDDKKLGCMLMLTGLVEISPDAAAALPQFIQ